MDVILAGTAILQFAATALSFRFVVVGRLGRPWLLVSIALLATGALASWQFLSLYGDPTGGTDPFLAVYHFSVSVLFFSGFLLTELWFRLRERLEARFRLIAEVDRELIGLLDEDRIVGAVCDILARGRGCPLVWIGAAQDDGTVRPIRATGSARELLSRASVRWDETEAHGHPAGIALRTRQPCVVNGIGNDPRFADWMGPAAERGIESVASFPLEPISTPRMVLSVCAAGNAAFDRLEIAALGSLADRVGTALQGARRHEFFVCAKTAFDDLLTAQRDGILLVREAKIVRANPAALGMLGYAAAEEILKKDPASLLLGSGGDPELATLLRAGDPGGWRSIQEAAIRRRDGSRFAGEVTAAWVPRNYVRTDLELPLAGPLGMIIFRDITARKQVLDDLRRERDFSTRILDVAGLLVAQLDAEGKVLLVNRQFEAVTGFASVESVGRRIDEFLVEEGSREMCRGTVAAARQAKAPADFEFPIMTKDGERRLILWSHATLCDDGGGVRSIIVTGTDVTERRRLERQVVEMQRMEAVGTLAGGVAHDFNNILTGIIGNLDLALRSLPPRSAASLPVHESIRASERAARLIRQLLEFSRKAPIHRKPLNVGRVMNEAAHLFSQTLDRRIAVEVYAGPELWPAIADPDQLHQVLMNLSVNARDALMECLRREPEGARGPDRCRIRIRAGNATVGEEYCRRFPFARKGEFVRLSISDTGAGMDAETLRRVFEPFFTTKGLGRGTGLGLSTVYGIVRQHEGWVTVESAVGQGTTFHVYLPRAGNFPAEKPQPAEPERPRRGAETILFVDDEEMIRELGRQILESHGYSVLLASDGLEALDLYAAESRRIDLVVLDQTMPNLSGVEALARIREIDPGARVILSSGDPGRQEFFRREVEGASGFLQKPYRADALARAVRDVLDGKPIG